MRYLAMTLAAAGAAGAVLLAPAATAAPRCTQTGPTTTQCETPGHSQITTSPPATNGNPWWPFGGGYIIGFPR